MARADLSDSLSLFGGLTSSWSDADTHGRSGLIRGVSMGRGESYLAGISVADLLGQ